MKRNLGIIASCLPGVTEYDALDKIKAAGFDTVFSGDYRVEPVVALKNKCEKLGLTLETLHTPFDHINDIWLPGLGYRHVRDGIKSCIDAAAAANVPAVVLHASSGFFPPPVCDIGLNRFDDIIDYAVGKGVKVAIENLRKLGNVTLLLERYEKIPEVGFCYDCGHEHCYTETVHYMDIYGKITLCTHIHDNPGRDHNDYYKDTDQHLVPFDGTVDYADMMMRIRRAGYEGPLTLELSKRGKYAEKSDEEFLQITFERLQKIAAL